MIACEDTRRTRALLSAHDIPAPRLVVCDERRESGVAEELAALAASGTRVALVSDAGTPALADPGREVVRTALAAGAPLTVLPGASAVTTALVASGLAAEGFAFWGWVPRRGAERARWLERAASSPLPVVAFESPNRLLATLAAAPAGRRRGGLPRAQQAARGGRAGNAARGRGRVLRARACAARSCWSSLPDSRRAPERSGTRQHTRRCVRWRPKGSARAARPRSCPG